MYEAAVAAIEQVFRRNGPVVEITNHINAHFLWCVQGQGYFIIRGPIIDAQLSAPGRILWRFDDGHQVIERFRIPSRGGGRDELYFVVAGRACEQVVVEFDAVALGELNAIV